MSFLEDSMEVGFGLLTEANGQSVTITPASGSPVTTTAVFTPESDMVEQRGQAAYRVRKGTLHVPASVYGTVKVQKDLVSIGGVTYRVTGATEHAGMMQVGLINDGELVRNAQGGRVM